VLSDQLFSQLAHQFLEIGKMLFIQSRQLGVAQRRLLNFAAVGIGRKNKLLVDLGLG
jgi:predicted transport protein